jgi:hypothetical protein
MRCLIFLFCVALASCAMMPDEVTNLDEQTELLQEKGKGNLKMQLKARATMMIGVHEVDAAKVEMAKRKLRKYVHKLGRKHPQFIGEAAGVVSLVEELNTKVNPDCVNNKHKKSGKSCLKHGFTKLKKVLDKVDTLEMELKDEKEAAQDGRKKKEKECQTAITTNNKAVGKMQNQNKFYHAKRKYLFANIDKRHYQIGASRTSEGGAEKTSLQSLMKTEVDESKTAYDDYWTNTDDRALVRNILMQAMWLVCTGFRSFRMHPYCVTLRKQPDYKEPKKGPDTVNPRSPTNKYRKNLQATTRFSDTMKTVWKQQKIADADAVNRGDGDVDMEKGFVNNRAPWGVAPDGKPAVAKPKELTREELSQRLAFLIETNHAPSRVASPLVDFVSALQTETGELSKKSKSLVDTIVAMDREEGEAQAKEDQEWMLMIKEARKITNDYSGSMQTKKERQEDKSQIIAKNHKHINQLDDAVSANEKQIGKLGDATRAKVIECDTSYIEFDTVIEMANEELVNIQRLNSLLRFLALGEEAKGCQKSGKKMCTSAEQGTCTWQTRGKDHKGGKNANDVFCACEYGFYGEACELRNCPGFGNIRYRAKQDGCCMNKGTCNTDKGLCVKCHKHWYHGPANKCEYKRCPKTTHRKTQAVIRMTSKDSLDLECSGKGTCNRNTGVCTCNMDNNKWYGDHCGYRKCPSTDRRGNPVNDRAGTSVHACNGRGVCEIKGRKNGKCTCSARFQGHACEFFKGSCQGSGKFQKLTGRCLCENGFVGGGCVKNSQGSAECQTCQYKSCPKKCHGAANGGVQPNGYCDRVSGKCICATSATYNGKTCLSICRTEKKLVDWSRSFDKWGWSVCPKKWLLTGFQTDGKGDALYNINLAQCERPCEGEGSEKSTIDLAFCYHENWWKKFDSKGGKFCRRNYFVAGLFRSHCNSLYCLEMAKCCQVKRSVWNLCQWSATSKNAMQRGKLTQVSGKTSFIAGFYRSAEHTLYGLTYFRQCDPLFYGAEYR